MSIHCNRGDAKAFTSGWQCNILSKICNQMHCWKSITLFSDDANKYSICHWNHTKADPNPLQTAMLYYFVLSIAPNSFTGPFCGCFLWQKSRINLKNKQTKLRVVQSLQVSELHCFLNHLPAIILCLEH